MTSCTKIMCPLVNPNKCNMTSSECLYYTDVNMVKSKMSSEQITYTSDNGYTGILYGRTSYAVFDSNGREVFHTGSRTINTLEELKKQVDNFPEFHEMLLSLFRKEEGEKE